MRRFRSFLTYVVLAGCTCVTVAAALAVSRQGLPEQTEQDFGSIVRLLAKEDVQTLDDSTRRRLIARIDDSTTTDFDWQVQLDVLAEEQRERATENLYELMRIRFLDRVATYHQLEQPLRPKFIQRETREMLRWPIVRSIGRPSRNRRDARAMQTFVLRALQWRQNEPPEVQQQIDAFIDDARESLMAGFDPLRSS